MGIKEKLPLINSNSKGIRIVGYVFYGFIFLVILGMILPGEDETSPDTNSIDTDDTEEVSETTATLSHSGFGNYTFDGQEDVKASVKKGTDVVHMMAMSELPTDYGYTKDGASYTVTSTGKRLKGYADYTGDGYVIVLQPRRTSLTKNEFMNILDTVHRVD